MNSRLCFALVLIGTIFATFSITEGQEEVVIAGCACTLDYTPVCGSDGKTYGNLCGLECNAKSGVTFKHDGECVQKKTRKPFRGCLCPKLYSPVCASNGKTYPNRCVLNCARIKDRNLKFVRTGEC